MNYFWLLYYYIEYSLHWNVLLYNICDEHNIDTNVHAHYTRTLAQFFSSSCIQWLSWINHIILFLFHSDTSDNAKLWHICILNCCKVLLTVYNFSISVYERIAFIWKNAKGWLNWLPHSLQLQIHLNTKKMYVSYQ